MTDSPTTKRSATAWRRSTAASPRPGFHANRSHFALPLRWLGISAVIPYRKDQRPDDGRHRFDAALYRKRAAVEQCVGWLKENRAVGTRFDKLAVNYLAGVQLAMIRRYLRILCAQPDSADRA